MRIIIENIVSQKEQPAAEESSGAETVQQVDAGTASSGASEPAIDTPPAIVSDGADTLNAGTVPQELLDLMAAQPAVSENDRDVIDSGTAN